MSEMRPQSERPRFAIVLAKAPPRDLEAEITAGNHPRVEYLELARALGAEIIDYHAVARSPSAAVRLLARRLGPRWGLALLAYQRRAAFDGLYFTGEDVGIPFALLCARGGPRPGTTVVVHNADTTKRRLLLKRLARAFDRIICLGTTQEELLTAEIGIAPGKVQMLHNWIDHRFYAPEPRDAAGEYALSVGMERRDYRSLEQAGRSLPYRFHVVGSGFSNGAGFAPAEYLPGGENFTVGTGYSVRALRSLYADARLVVVPLHRSTYAAGVTALLEAMAMGKAVVTTASPGILDYTRDGRIGRVVPVGDVAALRQAIAELWESPGQLAEIGRQNRAWIEHVANTDGYVARVTALLGVGAGPRAHNSQPAAEAR